VLLKIKIQESLENLGFLCTIDAKFYIKVAYTKRQLGVVTYVSVFKAKATVAKNRKSVSAQ